MIIVSIYIYVYCTICNVLLYIIHPLLMRLRTVFASTKNWLRAVFYVSETGLKNVVIGAAFFDDFCPTSAVFSWWLSEVEAISNSRMLVILITCYYDFNYNNCPISAVPGKNENNKYVSYNHKCGHIDQAGF